MINEKTFITGVCGQDGAYLAHHLLSLSHKVVGYQRSSQDNTYRLRALGIDKEIQLATSI